MSVEVPPKSVIIEGDKTFFASKAAIDRFKKDLKNDDKVKLEKNDYFKEGAILDLREIRLRKVVD